MAKGPFRLLGLSALLLQLATALSVRSAASNSSSDAVKVHWIDNTPDYNPGATFGLPWPQGVYYPNNTAFTISSESSRNDVPLQSWVTGYWRDGSIQWTGHALPPTVDVSEQYLVKPVASRNISTPPTSPSSSIKIRDAAQSITVNTGNITVVFPKTGSVLVQSITTANGSKIGENGKLILQSQDQLVDSSELSTTKINYTNFESHIDNVTVSDDSTQRALVTVHGKHHAVSGEHDDWLPFAVRFYLYAGSSSVRIVHSIIFDGDSNKDFIRGLGIRFEVPLKGEELFDRHVRLPGVDDGYLHEAVHGITGLRRDPGEEVRSAQFKGQKLPSKETWDKRVTSRLHWVPVWNDYKLNQLSPDGFTLKKRTKQGQGWINIPGGTRSHGLTYLGGATKGGLAIGLRDFWKRYPSGIEISNAGKDKGEFTLWLYNPEATPLDLRPFHDHLGMNNYTAQLDGLEITYEDYEPGFNTPYGISRSSEIFLYAFDATPSTDHLATLSKYTNLPPALSADVSYIQQTHALGSYWGVQQKNTSNDVQLIEKRLDFLVNFYQKQVDYRRWYGFLDYGDVMHTYDNDRHIWRYDVGGYAWDNSELSSDMWLWQYYLHTGRSDVYRFAEAMLRHTSEVDVYHYGKWSGLGTRHSVQHFSDSGKQVRITQPQYRKYFYFLSGGDERVGELFDEALDSDKTFDILDDQRKVRKDGWVPKPGEPVSITLGTDWSSLAAGWLIEWQRRGKRWEEARTKLTNTAAGIGRLKNGFLTGYGLLHINNGSLGAPPGDPKNKGYINVSQLDAVFGLLEVVSEMVDYYGDALPEGFDDAFLQYCEYYHTSAAVQKATFGSTWKGTLYQGHSRLESYYAWRRNNATAAKKAWNDFWDPNDKLDFTSATAWNSSIVNGSDVLIPVEEAPWLSTNAAAQFGLAAIQNLQLAGKWIKQE